MSTRAVIVVDLQNEYLPTGKLPLQGIEAATANAAQVIEAARARGDLVVHVRHEMPSADAPVAGDVRLAVAEEVRPTA